MPGKTKTKSTDVHGNVTKTTIKGNKKKEVTRVKREYASNAKPLEENPTVKRKIGKRRYVKKTTYATNALPLEENDVYSVKTKGFGPIKMNQQAKDDLKYMPVDDKAATMKKGPIYKTEAREARDYAANAVYDTKHGKKSEAKFEKKKLMHIVNSIAGSRSRG